MNPPITGLIAALLSLVAFSLTYRFVKSWSIRDRLIGFLIFTLLALPGASFSIYYLHRLPEPAWYYEFRSWRGIEFCLIVVGIAGAFVASLLPRILLAVPLFLTAAATLLPFMKPIAAPVATIPQQSTWENGLCLQSTASTCGPSSLATILKSLDIETTEHQLAKEAYTYAGGTEAWYLARAARRRGLNVKFEFSEDFDPSLNFPAIVGVKIGSIGHFIAILGKTGDKFIVGDPFRRMRTSTIAEMKRGYIFTGFHMQLSNPLSPKSNQ